MAILAIVLAPVGLALWLLAVRLIEAPMHENLGRARGRGEGRR